MPPQQPSSLPPPPEDLQLRVDAIEAKLKGVKSLDRLTEADDVRRNFGFFFYVVGAVLPTFVVLRLLLCPPPENQEAGVAFWVIHALPLAASILLGGAMFAVAGRLQISTDAIERIELQKAKSRGKATSTLAVDLPKTVRLGSTEE